MKSIDIIGKRNIDKITGNENPIRKDTIRWNIDDIYYTYNKQVELINQIYLEEKHELEQMIKREIKKKINGYEKQDIQNNIHDKTNLISLTQTIEKLVISKLKCFYCKEQCELLYTRVFSKKQWTLDRINNAMGHNHDNVVICCLDCNVKRGNMDSNRFKRGKEIKIVRKQF